ncbi:terminase large subunit domain-containing protein [Nitrospirillum amazonense]|uniref:terminase large subunit domain-containing protein n=1 Tax=Nitrospirillum amazonense TaxID=28077 RepID=UPI00241280F7|nr:terminase family protein [Nitrospirillum amazonense]MDG3442461.1 terminase family protein [Nitrospirillum amazonense]
MADATVIEESCSSEEERQLLGLVDQIQEAREGRRIPTAQIPEVLLRYQQKWIEDLAPVRLARKSRRVGFTWGCMASESVLEAGATRGMDQFYMGYNKEMAAEFIGDTAFWARGFQSALNMATFAPGAIEVSKLIVLIENERRDIVRFSMRLATGFKIESLSSNPHNWRGRQGHARIDEAGFHARLSEVIKGAMAFLMWGGRVSIVSTDNGEDSEFHGYVKMVEAGKLPWSYHKVTFDDALRDGFYRRVCLIANKPWTPEGEEQYRAEVYASYPDQADAQEELDCIPKRGSGAYFTRAHFEACWDATVPMLRLAKPAEFFLDPDRLKIVQDWINDHLKPVVDTICDGGRTTMGMDFGRDGDLSVLWVNRQVGINKWRTAVEIELRRLPFDCQRLILYWLFDHLPLLWHVMIDARGNGQQLAEEAQQKYGLNKVTCVKATVEFYAKAFPAYRAAYEDKSLVVPMSEDIVADHRRVVLVKGRPTMDDGRDKGSDGMPRHGDSAVAGLLAYEAGRENAEPSILDFYRQQAAALKKQQEEAAKAAGEHHGA